MEKELKCEKGEEGREDGENGEWERRRKSVRIRKMEKKSEKGSWEKEGWGRCGRTKDRKIFRKRRLKNWEKVKVRKKLGKGREKKVEKELSLERLGRTEERQRF
jgi:hypothetical protein